MKHLFLVTSLALSLSCGAAFAQTAVAPPDQADAQAAPQGNFGQAHHHHRPDPQRQTALLTQQLNLSPDQANRIEPILANRDQQMAGLHGNTQLSPEERHQQMHAINQQARQQMEAILSPEQAAELKQLHHHHRQDGDDTAAPQPPSL